MAQRALTWLLRGTMGRMGTRDERDMPRWRAGVVAERLGISPSTLRSWNHRYGVGPTRDRLGTHRLYSEADLAQLRAIQAHTATGMPARVAVELARTRLGDGPAPREKPRRPIRTAAGIEAAARRLDTVALVHALEAAVREQGALASWERLCRTPLARLGVRDGACSDADMNAESVLTYAFLAALHRVMDLPRAPATVLLAGAAGERHSLGIETLHVALAEQRIATQLLGPAVADAALLAAAARLQPRVLVLSAHRAATARPVLVRRLAPVVPEVIPVGPGWTGRGLPRGVTPIDDLTEAFAVVTRKSAPLPTRLDGHGHPAGRPVAAGSARNAAES